MRTSRKICGNSVSLKNFVLPMESGKNSIRFIEPMIHILVWVLFFGFPLLLLSNESAGIDWERMLSHSIVPLFFCIVFYLNYCVLIPKLLFRGKVTVWVVLNLAAIVLASSFMQALHLCFVPAKPLHDLPRFRLDPGILFFFRDIFSLALVIGVAVSVQLGRRWLKTENARKEAERLMIEAEQGRTEAELKNLRNQLNPHFLLNTLNNIYALIAFDPDKAQMAVSELSRLLRYVLYDNQQETVPLGGEVAFIRNYIELMRLRLTPEVSLDVDIDISEDSRTPIAPMLFISLIENAFKHGVSPSGKSFVKISLSESQDAVLCDITNSYHPKSRSDRSGSGIGLDSLSRRLELLYPGRYEWTSGPDAARNEYRSTLIIRK